MRRGRALRRRYGRALASVQAISHPVGGGMYEVVLVNGRGDQVGRLARRVPYSLAKAIIKRRHG